MAHPQKSAATAAHSAKLRRMTRDYGAANPTMNKLAPMDRLKEEGPEQPVGFGAEYDAATARGDRPARRAIAANPLATYKRGGAVRERAFGGRLDEKTASPKPGKGATNVNVIIAPQGGGQPGAGAVPPPMAGPPVPPSAAPAPPPTLPPGMGAAMPPGMMPRAKGGRVTGYDAGAATGEGRLEKIKNYGRKTANANPQVV